MVVWWFLSHFKGSFIWQWYRWFGWHWAKTKNDCTFHCAISMQSDLEWKWSRKKSHSKADLSKRKWNGLVSCCQHSYFRTCPFKEAGGVFSVKVFTSSMWRIQHLVSAFIVLLADQHRKRSCLVGASMCFWTQDTEYLQQVTKSAQFSPYLVPVTFLPVQAKHLPVKTSVCQSSRSSVKPLLKSMSSELNK